MKESILDVLLYLFEHVLDADAGALDGAESRHSSTLLAELADAGFSTAEIQKAFDWLDALAQARPVAQPSRGAGPVRVYAGTELDKLDADARGFLMFLEQHGVLDAAQRELVVDRALALEQDAIDIDDLKWVVLMVLFDQPGSEAAYAWMQTQVFDDEPEPVH
jgi:Smg protein